VTWARATAVAGACSLVVAGACAGPARAASARVHLSRAARAGGRAAPAARAPGADPPPPSSARALRQATAPAGPPLTGPGAAAPAAGEAAAAGAEADPLVDNGLSSPLCSPSQARGELSQAAQRNCETSGFVAAQAPTGNYGLDVHIDTGVLGLSEGGLLSVVQDVAIQPVWMALVWAVHALIVVLQWAFTLELLDSAGAGAVGAGLRHVQASFTLPWLALTLALAAVVTAYTGLVRRRVGEAVVSASVMLAMIAASLAIADDPAGTIGLVGAWANGASLGTLSVVTGGGGESREAALAASAEAIFASAIETPWCYLEFGDVAWCEQPGRLDPRLRAAGLQIAATELSLAHCQGPLEGGACPSIGRRARALTTSARLLRGARTNGQLFLALPTNGPERNSINRGGSLLRVLCGSADATACTSATASEAEFRTNRGTWPRFGGLLLIVAGAGGLLLLLGFIIARLLAAALLSLLLLLLAPAVALAPALGEGGRELFRRWAAGLLAAVALKLVFAFLLGAVLVVAGVLGSLRGVGWWTQWLLTSAFWWGAFMHRHVARGFARSGHVHARADVRPPTLGRRAREMFDTPRTVFAAQRALRRPAKPGRELAGGGAAAVPRERAAGELAAQVARVRDSAGAEAAQAQRDAPALQRTLASRRQQLARVERASADAHARGDTRRAALLDVRAGRLGREIAAVNETLALAAGGTDRTHRGTDRDGVARVSAHELSLRKQSAELLDAQAALPAASSRAAAAGRRDYPALAGLAGYSAGEYRALLPRAQREARLQIDRELAKRRALTAMTGDLVAPVHQRRVTARERARAMRAYETQLAGTVRAAGTELPDAHSERTSIDRWRAEGRRNERRAESRVMEDLRAVRDRRKRQLGFDNE
jgi:hypothetical protein